MKKLIVTTTVMLGFFLAVNAFGQDASLGGTVTDASGGVVAGATVMATNENTGVVSTSVTNNAGVYSFSRLLFGSYTVKAQQKGFQQKSFTKVSLQVGQQARLNFQLEISGVATNVEVSTTGEQLLLESSSSVGDVLPAKTVQELPQVNRDTMDLIRISSGVIVADDPVFGAVNTSFAGVNAAAVNVQMDGTTVNGVRFLTGVNTPTRVNPDLVGEFKMVLAPVDAEVGRGNAQIQIATKSGTNEYHGNVVWNVQNTALDPNTWTNNKLGAVAPWRNLQEYSASIGGPIVKNKTFFFALFDDQVAKRRAPYNAMSITPCARKGIFRFWDRWNNGNAQTTQTISANGGPNPVIATVDKAGNPVKPQWEPNAWGKTAYTGSLRAVSIFGPITNLSALNADCSNAQFGSGSWDPLRTKMDPSGYIADYLQKLPAANNYDIGDGLNTAGFRWTRSLDGSVNLWGIGEDQFRRQINVRIDHNFSAKHRINGTWSFEKDHGDDTPKTWPTNSWSGGGISQPQVLSINFLSNISATLLNEARFGMSRTGSNIYSAADRPGNGDELKQYLAKLATLTNGEVGIVEAGSTSGDWGQFRTDGGSAFGGGEPHISSAFGTRGGWANGNLSDISPRYQWGDTITWIKGAHSLRVGGEFRRSNSHKRDAWLFNPSNFQWGDSFAEIQGGELPGTPQTFPNVPREWGFDEATQLTTSLAGSDASNGNKRAMRDMLIFLSGSLASIKQVRYVNNINQANQGTWNDPTKEPAMDRNTILKEFSFFAKDDWKIRPNLTLNLGVRWDYYGVPYLANGMTVSLKGGGSNIFGPTGSYANWFAPIKQGDTPSGSTVSLINVGPDSANPDISLFPKTWTNVGPAVGFAYELPWFGKGKTTIRGGYQRSFISMAGNFQYIESAAGSSPGFFNINVWNNGGNWPDGYFGIKDLKTNPLFQNGVPINVKSGLTEFPLYDRQQSVSAYSSDYGYPHVDNLIFAVTRNVTSNLSVDMRYIGTLTRRLFSNAGKDINVANFISNGLLQAFNSARSGGNPVLLDKLLSGVALVPWGCTVDGNTCKGGDALRNANFWAWGVPAFAPGWFTNMNSMLANGNYQALANTLNYVNKPGQGYGQYMVDNGFPVNFIKASPQFNTATLYENKGYANYHSLQAQVTLRPTHGLSFQSTYTLSKNLGYGGGLSPDPLVASTGYTLQSADRTHNWVTFGTFDLPFGSRSQGALARVIGGWQLGWITSVISGGPLALTANCGLYANCTPDAVNGGIDPASASVSWPNGAANGSLFANRYVSKYSDGSVAYDPQCAGVWNPSLCTMTAIVDSKTNKIVLQNPAPGKMGTVGFNSFRDHGRWNVDMSVSKSVAVTESKSFRFRADFSNIFNHPMASGVPAFGNGTRVENAGSPSMAINSSTPIGYYDRKVGGRTFQAMLRFDF